MLINDQSRYYHPERNLVILSAAKDLSAQRARPFAALRVTSEGSHTRHQLNRKLINIRRGEGGAYTGRFFRKEASEVQEHGRHPQGAPLRT